MIIYKCSMRIYKCSMGFRIPAVDQSHWSIEYNYDLNYLTKAVCSNPNPVPIGRGTLVPSSIALFKSTALSKPHSCLDMSILLLGLACSVNHCRPDDQSFQSR